MPLGKLRREKEAYPDTRESDDNRRLLVCVGLAIAGIHSDGIHVVAVANFEDAGGILGTNQISVSTTVRAPSEAKKKKPHRSGSIKVTPGTIEYVVAVLLGASDRWITDFETEHIGAHEAARSENNVRPTC